MYEKYIKNVENKFIIKRVFNNVEYEFGCCESLEEAKKRIDQLDKDGWPINTQNIIKTAEGNFKKNKETNEIYFNSKDKYQFDIKVGKAYKHGFLVLTRKDCYEFFPKISYENECDIILDGIESKARLNFVPRLVIDRKNEKLINHLKKLSEIDPKQRRIVTLIKQNNFSDDLNISYQSLKEENQKLQEKINRLTKMIEELYYISSDK